MYFFFYALGLDRLEASSKPLAEFYKLSMRSRELFEISDRKSKQLATIKIQGLCSIPEIEARIESAKVASESDQLAVVEKIVSTCTERSAKVVEEINHWSEKPASMHASLETAFRSSTTPKKVSDLVSRIEKSVKHLKDCKLRSEEMVAQAQVLLDLAEMNVKATTKTNPNPQVEALFTKLNGTVRGRYHAVKESLLVASAKVTEMLAPSQHWTDWKASALAKMTPVSPRTPATKSKRQVSPAPAKGPLPRNDCENRKRRT